MKFIFVMLGLLAATCTFGQPYEPHAIWQREGAGDSSLYGTEILALGDQNNDGYNDWAIYAAGLGYAPPGSPNEPKVEFFHGGNPPDTVPYMVRVADRATEVGVRGARALDDLNGDGYVDWYIFTSYMGDSTGRHIYKIYFGGPGPHEQPDLILTSPILSGYDPIGDFNGDGYDDLFLSDGLNERAAIYFGGNPMDSVPDWQRADDSYSGHFADVNHDGFSDIPCFSNHTGHTDIFLGANQPDTIPAYHWPTLSPEFIRDLNGDDFDDLCFPRSGWGGIAWGGTSLHMTDDAHLDFPCSGSGPQRIVSAGDFNHDGYDDVVMLHEWCENSWYGVLTLHLGHPSIYSQPSFVIYGWTDPLNLIHFKTAVCLGDVNGDHIDDLGVGAYGGIEYVAQRGKVVILEGDTSLHAAVNPQRPELAFEISITVFPNPFNAETTIQLNVPVFSERVELTLYNVLGQSVREVWLHNVVGPATYHLNAGDLSSGIYLLHVQAGALQTTEKLMLLR